MRQPLAALSPATASTTARKNAAVRPWAVIFWLFVWEIAALWVAEPILLVTPLSALAQLKPFTAYLGDPRFSLLLPIIEADEYRLLDGWGRGGKRGSHRYELMPMALLDTVVLKDREDYVALFPESLADGVPFLAKDFGKATRLRGYDLYHALSVFEALGVIKPCGKKGNATLWCVSS